MPHWPGLQSTASREEALLAPYAIHSVDSAGRQYPEPAHPYRGPFQRDRDRILHSAAYRRLSGKMQVFTGDMGDYHRTRLTHTMEVASIARTIGRALRLNEDLIEALALLHDIGHPPFGHAGEDALDEGLCDEGGFSHNRFALTLVQEIEHPYDKFPGLNLTHEVLHGQATRVDKSASITAQCLEVQVVDVADSITYDAHDTDDAVELGLVELDQLLRLPMIQRCLRRQQSPQETFTPRTLRKAIVRQLIDLQVGDVLRRCGPELENSGWRSSDEASQSGYRIGAEGELLQHKQELERFLHDRVYRHARLIQVRSQAQSRLREMLDWLGGHPESLPAEFQRRAKQIGPLRAAADYLAGMTDRFCLQQHQQCLRTDLRGVVAGPGGTLT